MMAFIRPRLRRPLGIALAGTVFAAAWALRGGDAWQLSVAMVAAFIGVTIGVAVKATWWWPFLVILAVAGFGQLLGWSTYTTAEEGPADDASPQHKARSPASR
jgi:fatty acid desaturase